MCYNIEGVIINERQDLHMTEVPTLKGVLGFLGKKNSESTRLADFILSVHAISSSEKHGAKNVGKRMVMQGFVIILAKEFEKDPDQVKEALNDIVETIFSPQKQDLKTIQDMARKRISQLGRGSSDKK